MWVLHVFTSYDKLSRSSGRGTTRGGGKGEGISNIGGNPTSAIKYATRCAVSAMLSPATTETEPTINLSCLRWAWRACSRRFSDAQTGKMAITHTPMPVSDYSSWAQFVYASRGCERVNVAWIMALFIPSRTQRRKIKMPCPADPTHTRTQGSYVFANANEKLCHTLQRGEFPSWRWGVICYGIITIDFICLAYWYRVLFLFLWYDRPASKE